MRRIHIVLVLVVSITILLAVIITASKQSSVLEQVAAIFLGFLGGLAAVAEILGLLDRLGIPETITTEEPKFISKAHAPFETSVAIWGPVASGKSWMINALRWTLHRKYEGKYLGLQYNINKIDEFYFHTPEDLGYVYDFDYLAHAPPPTPEGYMSYFRFERNKTSNNPSESISSFVHNIHIYDSKGGDSMTIVEGNNSDDSYLSDTILDFADADILIIVLDPIMIAHQSKTDNNEFSGRITTSDYAAMVRRLFAIVEKSNPEKQRLYAVCVTKADLIKGSTYLHPDAIIETFFGSEMSEALKMPKKGIVQTFTTSSFGFLPGTTRPNFDSSSQRIVDKEHWQPYGIEYPFFWAFELEEKKLVEKLFSKSLWGKLAHRSKLLQYIPYPKPTYKT